MLDEVTKTEQELAYLRNDLMALAENLVGSAQVGPGERALLLRLKRDCFNSRSLKRYKTLLPINLQSLSSYVERALWLEGRVETIEKELEASYEEEFTRQLYYIHHFLSTEHRLRRVISFSSPDLLEALSFPMEGEISRRQEKRLLAVLRYLSRGVLKPSPFSRLTRIGFCDVTAGDEDGTGGYLELLAAEQWTEIAIVRLRRVFSDQLLSLLIGNSVFRGRIMVALNDSLEECGENLFRMLKPSGWSVSDSGDLAHYPMKLTTILLRGSLIYRALDRCRQGAIGYHLLTLALATELRESALLVDRQLLQLIREGVLLVNYPWPSDELCLEARIASFLSEICDRDGDEGEAAVLQRVGSLLESLVREEEVLRQEESSEARIRWVERLCDGILAELMTSVEHSSIYEMAGRPQLFDDTFTLRTACEDGGTAISLGCISGSFVKRIFDVMSPLVASTHVFDRRFELLHSLASFVAGQGSVPLLSLIHDARPIWKEYFASVAGSNWRKAFNPSRLEVVDELQSIRGRAWEALAAAEDIVDDEGVFDQNAIIGALQEIPRSYWPITDPCLFVQPIDIDLCVVNQIFDGTGRAISRYFAALGEERSAQFRQVITAMSDLGEAGELLDVAFTRGEILNVHPIQTPKILELPGERFDLPSTRVVKLKDLVVRFDTPSGLPEIRDARSWRRYLPVHLGASNPDFMPTLVRFLLSFGPGQSFPILPPRRGSQEGSVTIYPRRRIACCVLTRREWKVPIGELRRIVFGLRAGSALLAIRRWRNVNSVPERAFFRILLPAPGDARTSRLLVKPQYVDFGSPSLVENFLRAVRQFQEGVMKLTEVFPDWILMGQKSPEHRTLELQLDGLRA